MKATDFYRTVLGALHKAGGSLTTDQLRQICTNGDGNAHPVKAAVDFSTRINQLEKGHHITGHIPGSEQQHFFKASAEHSITTTGRAMLKMLEALHGMKAEVARAKKENGDGGRVWAHTAIRNFKVVTSDPTP